MQIQSNPQRNRPNNMALSLCLVGVHYHFIKILFV